MLYDAKVKVLGEYITHHVIEEHTEMFPKCRRASMDLVALRAEMEARKLSLLAQDDAPSAAATGVAGQVAGHPRLAVRKGLTRGMATPVTHDAGRHRFEAVVDGHGGHLDYALKGGVMTIRHTEVDPALEGRGVAGALVNAALDHARANALKVEPSCPYAASYMQRHPESSSLRA